VVEVKFIPGAAFDTLTAIALPDLKFDARRNDSAAFGAVCCWKGEIFISFHGQQSKFEYRPTLFGLCPSIDQVKDAVI